jgi:hypothetical protein
MLIARADSAEHLGPAARISSRLRERHNFRVYSSLYLFLWRYLSPHVSL